MNNEQETWHSPSHNDAFALVRLRRTVAFSSFGSCTDRYTGCFGEDFSHAPVMLRRAFCRRSQLAVSLEWDGRELPTKISARVDTPGYC